MNDDCENCRVLPEGFIIFCPLHAAAEDMLASIRTILQGFESGVFIRNISGDGATGWAMKILPFILALAKAEDIKNSVDTV